MGMLYIIFIISLIVTIALGVSILFIQKIDIIVYNAFDHHLEKCKQITGDLFAGFGNRQSYTDNFDCSYVYMKTVCDEPITTKNIVLERIKTITISENMTSITTENGIVLNATAHVHIGDVVGYESIFVVKKQHDEFTNSTGIDFSLDHNLRPVAEYDYDITPPEGQSYPSYSARTPEFEANYCLIHTGKTTYNFIGVVTDDVVMRITP